jgi:hypothetical protein
MTIISVAAITAATAVLIVVWVWGVVLWLSRPSQSYAPGAHYSTAATAGLTTAEAAELDELACQYRALCHRAAVAPFDD